jgi:4-carboxymuconolactone decarboxylase
MFRTVALLAVGSCLAASPLSIRAEDPLPADIDPVSLSRLPVPKRAAMDAEGQRIYDLVAGRDGREPRTGPAAISLHSPKVAEAMHILNSYLRTDGVLGPRFTEVAILVAAWEIEQQYEWSAHEPAARRAGAPEAVIDAIKYDRDVAGLPREESTIIRLGRELLREHRLSPELYREAVALFGERGTVEMAALIGDYVMAGIMLQAVDQHLPADRPALLPER